MAPRVNFLGTQDGMNIYEDERGNRFSVPVDVTSLAGRMHQAGGRPSANIEDRRAENPPVAPSAPDAVLRGMPQTPYEVELYKRDIRAGQAVREGRMPEQQPSSMPGMPVPEPSQGDPAGIESSRRIQRDSAVAAARAKLGL